MGSQAGHAAWLRAFIAALALLVLISPLAADNQKCPHCPGLSDDAIRALRQNLEATRPKICDGNCTASEPLVIEKTENRRIANLTISGAGQDCIKIINSKNITVEAVKLRGCRGHGIVIAGSSDISINGVDIEDTLGSAVIVSHSGKVDIRGSRFARAANGVYAVDTSGVSVSGNLIVNMKGPKPRGQGIQFDKVSGKGNSIACNTLISTPGEAQVEDAINLYQSVGDADAPLTVKSNQIIGGGPSRSGGGILIGDQGGAHFLVEDNVLVDPGQYGIGVAGGKDSLVTRNQIFAGRKPFTNVGIYIHNFSTPRRDCARHVIRANKVFYRSAIGRWNNYWRSQTCSFVSDAGGIERVTSSAEAALRASFAACR